MTGAEFKAWREAAGLKQSDVSRLTGLSTRTVLRAEQSSDLIPGKLSALVLQVRDADDGPNMGVAPKPAPGAKVTKGGAAPVPAVESIQVTPELEAAMLRNPPYATTSAEAKAMRQLRAQQRNVSPSDIRLLPLRPVWRRLEASGRLVNAAIPSPLDMPAPAWAGPRGVPSATGEVFDYEGAHRMAPPGLFAVATPSPGQW